MSFAVATLLLALLQATPATVTGKWDGTVTAQREDGSTSQDSTLLILQQKDTTVTGTVGSNESDQMPVTSGTVEANKIVLLAKSESGREYRVELTMENDELKGTVTSGERRATVQARRRKE
jgi:hypothetical protein